MVIVTDAMYKNAISATRMARDMGEEVILVTTDTHRYPPSFYSRGVKEKYVFPSNKDEYLKRLLSLVEKYPDSVILPLGNFTLNILSKNSSLFHNKASFLVSSSETLSALNDKRKSKEIAENASFLVPELYEEDVAFPAVVKLSFGEGFSLPAKERYRIVKDQGERDEAIEFFRNYENTPLTEEYIEGRGVGVSLIVDGEGDLAFAFCHRRIYEACADGGPSTLIETFFDSALIEKCHEMLKSVGFCGIAMLEFKEVDGKYYFLEVNPRVWGSFPALAKADINPVKAYVMASRKEKYAPLPSYILKKRIKLFPGILKSVFSYLKKGLFKKAFGAFLAMLNPFIPDAMFSLIDPIPTILDLFRKRR